jgi:hypothetical protein
MVNPIQNEFWRKEIMKSELLPCFYPKKLRYPGMSQTFSFKHEKQMKRENSGAERRGATVTRHNIAA